MKRQDFSQWPCSIARVSDLIGDGWSPLVLRDIAAGLCTFNDLQTNLNVSRNTLTQRLNHLVQVGMLRRERYSEKPERFKYLLTEMGEEFVPVLLTMATWGDKWIFKDAPPYKVKHITCNASVTADVRCAECGEIIKFGSLNLGRSSC